MTFLIPRYEELIATIIRPEREDYELDELGPKRIDLYGKIVKREDFTIITQRGIELQCSHFLNQNQEEAPCVIYLHGNCSSRLEALPLVSWVLGEQMTLMTFDIAACGMSDGQYISLGWYESQDLDQIVQYMRVYRKANLIFLWGRSMGAVTSLLYAKIDFSVAGLVLDSPFAKLKDVMINLAKKHSNAPVFLMKMLLSIVRRTIKERAQFDIKDLKLKPVAQQCLMPALFITAREDDFVPCNMTYDVYQAYQGDKQLLYTDGGHNSCRDWEVYKTGINFLKEIAEISLNS